MNANLAKLIERFGVKVKELADIQLAMEREYHSEHTTQTSDFADTIELNVGGCKFVTLRSTLLKRVRKPRNQIIDSQDLEFTDNYYEPSLLEKLAMESGGCTPETVFIDRNSNYFSYVLDYLRTANTSMKFELPSNRSDLNGILEEARYYQIQGLVDLIKPFHESRILTAKLANDLIGLCDFSETSRWKLIYRGSRHGFSSDVFHNLCDSKPRTLTIVKSNYGNVFGGYTSKSWDQSDQGKKDHSAFLFSLVNTDDVQCKMNFIREDSYAIFCGAESGPSFGEGPDLFIASDANKNEESFANLGISFLFCNYEVDSDEAQCFLGGSYHFKVTEIEVYHLLEA
jgi:hypothetical protein